MARSTGQSRRTIHFNGKGALAVLVLIGAAVGGYFLLTARQDKKMRGKVLALVQELKQNDKTDLALRNLDEYLSLHPPDLEILLIKAKLLDNGAVPPERILDVARVYESVVRLNPEGEDAQKARRRLVELYVEFGDMLRMETMNHRLRADLATQENRSHVAESHAKQLIKYGDQEPEAHRLLAMTLDALSAPGDAKAVLEAVREYSIALKGDPTDLIAAKRLADLYLDRLNHKQRAQRVLDDILKALPEKPSSEQDRVKLVKVRMLRHKFFVKLRLDKEASEELEAATKIAPNDLTVLIAAAEDALRRRDTAAARLQLAKVPKTLRAHPRFKMIEGLVDFGDERPLEAIETWRQGLKSSSGTDADLSWWLAYALLQMDRIDEAETLIRQYGRLAGERTPLYGLLEAIREERTGRPAQAARRLERLVDLVGPHWAVTANLTLGRSYEALYDDKKAETAYRRAIQVDPKAVEPRLALAKLKLKTRAIDAVEELDKALQEIPGDPALKVALAGAFLRVQSELPLERRRWAGFDDAYRAAAAAAGDATAASLMLADRLTLSGQPEKSLEVLRKAAETTPKSASIAVALADSLSRRNQPNEAKDVLERALAPEAAGDQATLRIARARVLSANNEGRKAREALTKDLDRLPVPDRIQVMIALAQIDTAKGNFEAARRHYETWSRLAPKDPRPRLILLELALDQSGDKPVDDKEIKDILKDLNAATGGTEKVESNDIAYRLAQAKVMLYYHRSGKPLVSAVDSSKMIDSGILLKQAEQLVDAVLFEAPELPAAVMSKAEVLVEQGKPDEAIGTYERAWKNGNEAALPRIVSLMAKQKRFAALTRLRSEAKGATTQVDLLSAQAFESAGDSTQARKIAENVARDLPDSPEVLGWQAKMLNYLVRFDDAESALRAMAERQLTSLDPWLALLKHQAQHRREAVPATIARIMDQIKTDQPELLHARCLWTALDPSPKTQPAKDQAAKDLAVADKAFHLALAKHIDADSLLLAAKYFEETDRPGEAKTLLTRLLAHEPQNRPATRQLAVLLSSPTGNREDRSRARELLAEVNPTWPPDDRLAQALVNSRSLDAAENKAGIDQLQVLCDDLPPEHPVARSARDYLVDALKKRGEPGDSDRVLQISSVSAAEGTDPIAVGLYATALIQSKKPDAAEWVDRLSALSPGDPLVARLRVKLLWNPNRALESAASLERAYRIREDQPDAETLGREVFTLLAEKGAECATVAERVGRKIAEKNPYAAWMPALIVARRAELDAAFDLLKIAVKPGINSEDLKEAASVAMKIAVAGGDPVTLAKADATLESALKIEPDSDDVLLMKAMLRHIQGRYEDEVQIYQQVLKHRPDNFVVLNNLAWALSEGLHRPEEGKAYVDKLFPEDKNPDSDALDTRGVIYTRLKNYKLAVIDLEEAVRLEKNVLHYFHLARAYERDGRRADAKKCRDYVKKKGLSLEGVDAAERDDLKSMLEIPDK